MSSTDWEKLKDNLEPAARNYYFNPDNDIQLSIAISLKRIADKLELANKQPVIMNKEEYERYVKAKEFRDEAMSKLKKYE